LVYVKRFLIVALIALLGAFAFMNQQSLGQKVELAFFQAHVTLVFGFWILLGFIAGVLLFLMIDLPRSLSMKSELRRKSNELARLQFEIGRLQGPQSSTGEIPMVPSAPPDDIAKRLGL
jgi:uncharacterized integral membrane protein